MSLVALTEPLNISDEAIVAEFGTTPRNFHRQRLDIAIKLYTERHAPGVIKRWDGHLDDGVYTFRQYRVVYHTDTKAFVLFSVVEVSHISSDWGEDYPVSLYTTRPGTEESVVITSLEEAGSDEQLRAEYMRASERSTNKYQFAYFVPRWTSEIQVILARRKRYTSATDLLGDMGWNNVELGPAFAGTVFSWISRDLAITVQNAKLEQLRSMRDWMLTVVDPASEPPPFCAPTLAPGIVHPSHNLM